jgi:hypothetical protein
MRYQLSRKAAPSKENSVFDQGPPPPPPKKYSGAGKFIEDDKGRYIGNMPFVKPIHKKMKTYRGEKGES